MTIHAKVNEEKNLKTGWDSYAKLPIVYIVSYTIKFNKVNFILVRA